MKSIFLSCLALLMTGILQSQSAPDFTVTDTDGQEHHLYADYLDQGKTVLIKVFFTTCPPCNSIAPLMEPLYEEWGSGDYDVEFFDLSDKTSDTNPLVAAYKANYGHTYPAAGNEGGSVQAVAPYKNGTFGPWSGTPTFVVIAPDGSVQYDVGGPGNQATIDAIDAALAATGAEKPMQPETPVVVSGQVQFLQAGTGVGNAIAQVINGSGEVVAADTTSTGGSFGLPVFLSEVQPDWALRVLKSGNPTNGVNALDLLRIQKHLLTLEPITDPLNRIAADANRSATISTLDNVALTRLLLGFIENFPDGQSWIVIPADTDFGPPIQHPPVITEYSIPLQAILDGERSAQFIAIKRGDANGSANPNE